jgi:hypothetical protein
MARLLPYTLESFRRIVDQEERRGRNLMHADRLVRECTTELKALRQTFLSNLMDAENEDEASELRAEYREQRGELREARDEKVRESLDAVLHRFETDLGNAKFGWGLTKGPLVETRQTYVIPNQLHLILPMKQASAVLREAIGSAPQSRNSIVRALQSSLKKEYPHGVIRLDIKSFFDSIPHDLLLQKLARARKIDSITTSLTKQLLSEFAERSFSQQGVPQGVGLSSQLAEFYLADLDRSIRTQSGVVFYARYVDDIIIVTESPRFVETVWDRIQSALDDLGLELHPTKQQKVIAEDKGGYNGNAVLEYLGYEFRNNGKLETKLTDKRFKRQIAKIEQAFDAWAKNASSALNPNTGADGLLVDRIRYLTSNTKLHYSKSHVAIGIYFSNSALNPESPQLRSLDARLNWLIKKHSAQMSIKTRSKLESLSFVNGFKNRTFARFNQHRAERIVKCWENQR